MPQPYMPGPGPSRPESQLALPGASNSVRQASAGGLSPSYQGSASMLKGSEHLNSLQSSTQRPPSNKYPILCQFGETGRSVIANRANLVRSDMVKTSRPLGGRPQRSQELRTLAQRFIENSKGGINSILPQTRIQGPFFRISECRSNTFKGNIQGATLAISCELGHNPQGPDNVYFTAAMSCGDAFRDNNDPDGMEGLKPYARGVCKAFNTDSNCAALRNGSLTATAYFCDDTKSVEGQEICAAREAAACCYSLLEHLSDRGEISSPKGGYNVIAVPSAKMNSLSRFKDQPTRSDMVRIGPQPPDAECTEMKANAKRTFFGQVADLGYAPPPLTRLVSWRTEIGAHDQVPSVDYAARRGPRSQSLLHPVMTQPGRSKRTLENSEILLSVGQPTKRRVSPSPGRRFVDSTMGLQSQADVESDSAHLLSSQDQSSLHSWSAQRYSSAGASPSSTHLEIAPAKMEFSSASHVRDNLGVMDGSESMAEAQELENVTDWTDPIYGVEYDPNGHLYA
jgi:hypothetical protein